MTLFNPSRNIIVLLTLIALSTPVQADVVYNVVPYNLSNGYAIAGGTITTNDALDTIIAWDIPVTGALPYTFSNTNPGAGVYFGIGNFIITPTQIAVDTGFFTQSTGFFAADNTAPNMTDALQSLQWIASGWEITYDHLDHDDNDPLENASFLYNPGDTIIAATVVPEPNSAGLLALGGIFTMCRRRAGH